MWQASAPVEANARVWSTVALCGCLFASAHVALTTCHMQQLHICTYYMGHSQGHEHGTLPQLSTVYA